ncbi:MAG: hypothetical protein ACKOFP_10940 [Actinomycetota bacterium]
MNTRLLRASIIAAIAACTVVVSAAPASAHAIVDLEGDPAYAGRTSTIRLELQHGCLANEVGIDTVIVYLDTSFRSVRPGAVDGWKASTKHSASGTHKVTYTLTGTRPAFNTPTYFPLTIGWPAKAGVYGLPVKQKCEGEVNVWDVPDGPATANQSSPPLYPLPQIKVIKAK